jgi:hypothetical protein
MRHMKQMVTHMLQTLSTLDAMEHIQAHAGVDAYMFLQNEEGHEERLS